MLNTHIEADTVAKLQARVQELEHAVKTERMLRAKAKRRRKAAKQLGVNVWQAAIDRELVAAHLGVAGPATLEEARKAIRELILWNIQAATSTVPVAPASAKQSKIEPQPQPQHRDCGCSVCEPSFEADEPTLAVTVRYDLSPAAIDGAIRDKLIEMGWTPPAAISGDPAEPRDDSDRTYDSPIGYLQASELGRLHAGHDANLRSAKFGPSTLYGDVPVYLDAALADAQPTLQYGDDFWPVDGNASRKQLIKQIGQMNYRLTTLRQQNAGLVASVQRQAEALLNLQSAAALVAQGEALTDTYIQQVPDKCDRIVWRGRYYHLPIDGVFAVPTAQEGGA